MKESYTVLYVIRTWALGGSHTIITHLLEHLPKEKFTIVPVVYDSHSGGDEHFVKVVEQLGFQVAAERIPWKTRLAWSAARNQIDQLIASYNADLIHTHDPHSNVLVGIKRSRWKCACIASAYGWWKRLFPLRTHVHIWLERQLALPQFDRVITVSEDMRQKILRGPTEPHRVRVIHTGLDPTRFHSNMSRSEFRKLFQLPDEAIVIGIVGRIYIEKGHKFLIEATAKLAARFPNVYLLIVGEGPLRPTLEQLASQRGISDRVRFTGFFMDVVAAFQAMDIFCLPSILEEGFPTVILEAQLMRLPVIATDIGGTKETMNPLQTGLLVPPKDVSALEKSIESLIIDPIRRQQMGEAGRTWVLTQFTLENMIAQVSETYEEAIREFRAKHADRN